MDFDQSQLPPGFKPELVVKKEKGFRALNSSGLYWLLIILVLVLLAFSVNMFREPKVPGTSGSFVSSL
ncbi:MAG: hypothetical protein AAB799_00785 [Patescibacteria group bacterium]